MKNNINTQPMPGFMELLPNEQMAFNKMIEKIREIYDLYGFRPIETPLLERAEVLLTKGGGETDKQIYRFQKGDSDIALRFDLTVPLARYVSEYQNDLIFPFKIGNIGKVYRGEKPQAGRFREFYQCDADIIGRDNLDISYDAEIVSLINALLTNLGFKNFTIRVNNRKILNGYFQSLNIDNTSDVLRVLDKLSKIGKDNVIGELKDLGITGEQIEQIFKLVDISENILKNLKELNVENEIYKKGVEELEYVINRTKDFENNIKIDLTLSRGQDYYTGTVFEASLNDYPDFGSICGGGRYDNLTSYYTDNKFPGVGCSIGLTRLFDCLLRNNLVDINKQTSTKVLIIGMNGFDEYAIDLSKELRKENISTEVIFGLKNGFKYADRLNIPYVIVVGEEEVKKNRYTLKDMVSGKQKMVKEKELFKNIK
ncbi:MAG: histidine--tRNA ligase [Candidatus Dojkabacteria bacterium]|nr:histidine--tRNA ligase [Candidatus Dojkabacteria bacterium]